MNKYRNRNWLNQKYWKEELSPSQISKLCNCNRKAISYWVKKLDIPARSLSEAAHLAQANHCNLSAEARQWIDGEIMGDGNLTSTSKYSASFRYTSKYLEYIQYIADTLKSFGIKRMGKINKQYHKKMDCYTYQYASLFYKELLPIRKRWYPEGKKIIPRDLELTPLVLRQEHIGDGSLIHYKNRKNSKPYICLATCGFPVKDVEWLVKKLIKLGFKSTRQPANNIITISTYSTKEFLEYIGNSPAGCYEYKFNY